MSSAELVSVYSKASLFICSLFPLSSLYLYFQILINGDEKGGGGYFFLYIFVWGMIFPILSSIIAVFGLIFSIKSPVLETIKQFKKYLWSWIVLLVGAVLFMAPFLLYLSNESFNLRVGEAFLSHMFVSLILIITLIFILWFTIKEKNDERLDLFWGLIYTFTHLGVYANNKINSLHFLEYLPTAHALILILTCYLIRKRTSIIENNGVRVENNGVRVN